MTSDPASRRETTDRARRRTPHDRARRRATWFAIPAILILLALGSWQVHRLIWKTELNEERRARHQAEAVMLPADLQDAASLAYHRVWLEGRFRHSGEMFLAARTHDRRVGYQVITPFERGDGTVVLVNRGWVPLESKEPETRLGGQLEGTFRLEGIVVPGGRAGWFTPDNEPENNTWFWTDTESLAAKAGIPAPTFLVDAGPRPNPGGLPIGGQTRVELRSEHVQYIVIWYALAVSLAVIYVLYMRRGRNPDDGPDDGPDEGTGEGTDESAP